MTGENPRGRRMAWAGILLALTAAAPVGLALPSDGGAGTGLGHEPWFQSAKITPDDAHEDGVSDPETGNINPFHHSVSFGSSLDVDGATMAVGTAFDSCDLATWAYVFERGDTGDWNQVAKLTPSDGSHADTNYREACSGFGRAVAVDEAAGVIVVGNPGYDDGSVKNLGAAYIFERTSDGRWEETAKLEYPSSSVGVEDTKFGFAVSTDAGTVVVGAPKDAHAGDKSGSVYVYERADAGWSMVGRFDGTAPRDFLGTTVSTAGGMIVAGASQASSEAGPFSGVVHVFDSGSGTWSRAATLDPPVSSLGPIGESFGSAIEIAGDGSTIVVGAPGADRLAGVNLRWMDESLNTGTVYVFERISNGWELEAELLNPDPGGQEDYGESVGVYDDGSLVLVGAGADTLNAGAAYTFESIEDNWLLTSRLRNHDSTVPGVAGFGGGDGFGEVVAISEDALVVGAPFDDNRRDEMPAPLDDDGDVPPCVHPDVMWKCDHGENAGSVYVFKQTPSVGV